MHDSTDEPILVPAEPTGVARSSFPVVASLAPVVASVVIWALTRSPFVLIFALLSPVIAVASVVDKRWSARRRLRSETAEYCAELDRLYQQVDERHAAERLRRNALSTSARQVLDAQDASAIGFARWRVPAGRRFFVVAGRGAQPSGVRIDGPQAEGTTKLKERARMVPDVPVEVDASRGIGVVGLPLVTRAVARGLLVQLCAAASPEALTVVGVPPGWEWASALPHRRPRDGASSILVAEVAADATMLVSADILVVLADRMDRIPTRCAAVIELTGVATAILHRTTAAGHADPVRLAMELISAAESRRFAEGLAAYALEGGGGLDDIELPDTVSFVEASERAAPPTAGPSLSAVLVRPPPGRPLSTSWLTVPTRSSEERREAARASCSSPGSRASLNAIRRTW